MTAIIAYDPADPTQFLVEAPALRSIARLAPHRLVTIPQARLYDTAERTLSPADALDNFLTLDAWVRYDGTLTLEALRDAWVHGAKYSPDQPRDEHGRFGEGDGGAAAGAAERVPQFATTKEAAQWMRQNYPHTITDFKKMDSRVATATVKAADALFQKYPLMAARCDYIGTRQSPAASSAAPRWMGSALGKADAGVYAQCSGGIVPHWEEGDYAPALHFGLELNPAWASNYDAMTAALAEDVAAGYHPPGCDSVEAALTHELGHGAYDLMTQDPTISRSALFPYATMTGSGWVGTVPNAVDMLDRLHAPYYSETSGYAATGSADTQRSEAFAEAFASAQFTPPSEQSALAYAVPRLTGQILDAAQSGTLVPISQVQTLSDMTPADFERLGITRPAATQSLKDLQTTIRGAGISQYRPVRHAAQKGASAVTVPGVLSSTPGSEPAAAVGQATGGVPPPCRHYVSDAAVAAHYPAVPARDALPAEEQACLRARVSLSHKKEDGAKQKPPAHTGMMVALFLSPQEAAHLALPADWPGAEPAADLHITLAFLGSTTDEDAPDPRTVAPLVARVAAEQRGPLSGRLGGLGVFTPPDAGETAPLYASVDIPGLTEFRVALVAALEAAGIQVASEHGFTPHVTLAYLPPERAAALLRGGITALPNVPVEAGAVVLSVGDERLMFPFGPVQATGATKYSPDQERDERGRFGSGGDDSSVSVERDASGQPLAAPTGMTHTFLSQMVGVMPPAPPGWKYGSKEAYVLATGKQMPGAALPPDVERGTAKQCFRNATMLVSSHDGWNYTEGYATPAGLPIAVLHAWATDENGTVVDNTFPDPAHADYFGTTYQGQQYLDYVIGQKYYGVLGGDHRAVNTILKDGGLPPPTGKTARAAPGQLIALLSCLRDPSEIGERKYSPDQSRDDHGRFGEGGGSAGSSAIPPGPSQAWKTNYNTYRNEAWTEHAARLGISLAELKAQMTARLPQMLSGAHAWVRMQPANLNRVLSDGRFKTLFETNRSGAANFVPDVRKEAEQNLFGISPNADPAARPIYGYLSTNADGSIANSDVGQYGPCAVQLSDSVLPRSTFTMDDSLDATARGQYPLLVPRPVEQPSIQAFQANAEPSHIQSVNDVWPYAEVQTHGGISAKEIAQVIFTDPTRVPKATVAALNKAGIPYTVASASAPAKVREKVTESRSSRNYTVLAVSHDAPEVFLVDQGVRSTPAAADRTVSVQLASIYDRAADILYAPMDVLALTARGEWDAPSPGEAHIQIASPVRTAPSGDAHQKYSPDQERDERGRFGSGDGASVSDMARAAHPDEDFLAQYDKQRSHNDQAYAKQHQMTVEAYQQAAQAHTEQIMQDVRPFVRVPLTALTQIVADGNFKTQFDTGSSQGLFDPMARDEVEQTLFGDEIYAGQHPVYGYFANDPYGVIQDRMVEHYGGVTVELSDAAKSAATVTFTDSLDATMGGHYTAVIPSPANDPSRRSWSAHDDALATPSVDQVPSYAEAQYHGPLTTGMIKMVSLPQKETAYGSDLGTAKSDVIALLDAHQIPWQIRPYEHKDRRDSVPPSQKAASTRHPRIIARGHSDPNEVLLDAGTASGQDDRTHQPFTVRLVMLHNEQTGETSRSLTIFSALAHATWDAVPPEQDKTAAHKYSPDQERDDHGRFGSGGGSGTAAIPAYPASAPPYKRADWANEHLQVALTPGETAAVKDYTQNGFIRENTTLRAGEAPTPMTPLLDSAIAKTTLPVPMTVYRGTDLPISTFQAGGRFTDHGFLSTTLSENNFHVSWLPTRMEIAVPAGSHALWADQVWSSPAGENELLLPRDSSFRVLSVTQRPNPDTQNVVTLALDTPLGGTGSKTSARGGTDTKAGAPPPIGNRFAWHVGEIEWENAGGHGAKYSPDQPRAANGQFGEGDGSSSSDTTRASGYRPAATKMQGFAQALQFPVVQSALAGKLDPNETDGPHGDEFLYALAHDQGFDGPPQVVSNAQLDQFVANGEPELFRGVDESAYADQFKTGDYYANRGARLDGTFCASGEDALLIADAYTGRKAGEIMRLSVSPDATVISFQALRQQYIQDTHALYDALPGLPRDQRDQLLTAYDSFSDLGRYAMAKGYDAVTDGSDHTIILNRTAVRVQNDPVPQPQRGGDL